MATLETIVISVSKPLAQGILNEIEIPFTCHSSHYHCQSSVKHTCTSWPKSYHVTSSGFGYPIINSHQQSPNHHPRDHSSSNSGWCGSSTHYLDRQVGILPGSDSGCCSWRTPVTTDGPVGHCCINHRWKAR